MTVQLPPRPVLPASYVARVRATDAAIALIDATLHRGVQLDEVSSLADQFRALVTESLRPETDEERRDREEYDRLAAAYNAALRARRTERENQREVAKIRAARCPSCFTVPSASGACNC